MNSKKKFNIFDFLKKRNVKRFSLFMAIAFVFLIFSKLSNDYKQSINLKIELINNEEEIMLQQDSLNVLNAYVEAKGFAFVPFIFKNSKTIVLDTKTDLSVRPEYYIFDVQKHKYLIEEQLGTSYKILSIKPDTLLLPFSKKASKYVPVILNKNIQFADGFDVKGDFEIDIDSVKIVGSLRKIDSINSITTQQLNLKEVKTDIEEKIGFAILDKVEVFPKKINVRAKVKRFTEGKIQVPVTITNQPSKTKINHFPKTVTVSYYVDLDNYNRINISDFTVECNYNKINSNQAYFIPEITRKPEFVKRVSMKQRRIDFIKL